MTVALSGKEVAAKLEQQFPESIIESNDYSLLVKTESLFDIFSYLKTTSEFEFNYLSGITAVDYLDYFDVVYHITDDEKGVVLGGIKDGMIEVEWSSNTRSYCDITILYYKV